MRELKFNQAILEATDQCMAVDESVYLMGLGVPDPKGVFGTTLGLANKYGSKRVMDMPTSENAMTGVAIGSAIKGMRPVMTHQRVDFVLLALDQIINNAAKWHFMFGSQVSVPLVIRLVIGRGWGQGPQHSQSLQSLFAHIPGLKVLAPSTPHNAKGLLVAAIRDNNPVIFLEHRWLHNTFGDVPTELYEVPIGVANTLRQGTDVTIVSASYMTVEARRAAASLEQRGISAEVIDLQSLRPLDTATIFRSIRKTHRLVVADLDWRSHGFAAEILALVAEHLHGELVSAPIRVSPPDYPSPSSFGLSAGYYPGAAEIANAALTTMGLAPVSAEQLGLQLTEPHDVPDQTFSGPF